VWDQGGRGQAGPLLRTRRGSHRPVTQWRHPALDALKLACVVSSYPMDPAPFSAVLLAVLDAKTPAWRVVAALFVLAGALFLRFKS